MNSSGNTRQCSVNTKRTDILRGIIKFRRKRNTSVTKATSRDRSCLTQIVSSVSRLPGSCPSCTSPYDRSHKRRLVDSCGHERCYSCIGKNEKCLLCKQMGPELSLEHKRSRLDTTTAPSGPSCTSSPGSTLPRRRKEVTRRRRGEDSHVLSSVSDQLPKPLYLEVAGPAGQPVVGREWLWQDMKDSLLSHLPTNRGVVITGGPGSGKTALLLALVDRSCFGNSEMAAESESSVLGSLAQEVVAYHFCQADNSPTCLLPEFVHSVAAQLSQAPQLSSYHHLLQSEPTILAHLNLNNCHSNPGGALVAGILEPLKTLQEAGKICSSLAIILIDGLCEAEQHRPDYGDTLATFLATHCHLFPPWLKIVCTLRSSMTEICEILPFHRACLDLDDDERIKKDLSDYITGRISVTQIASKLHKNSRRQSKNILAKFSSFLVTKAGGCFLYVKLVLDLVEKGSLSIKSGSFKVVPQNLSEIYQLVFNLKFSSFSSYVQASDIFSICLATLEPVTLQEAFTVFSALSVRSKMSLAEFKALVCSVGELLVARSDGTLMCFHPTLRDWLVRRREGDSTKFLCDLRPGHAAIALSYSRQPELLHSADKVLALAHHVLKSNLFKHLAPAAGKFSHRQLQACFTSLSVGSLSAALASTKNIFSPILKVSRLLLLAGADPNMRTEQLHRAPLLTVHSKLGHTEMVSLLLEYGADPGLDNDVGQTALSYASGEGHLETVQLLLQCGSELSHCDHGGVSSVVRAARAGQLNVLEVLLSHLPPDTDLLAPLLSQALTQSILHSQPLVTDTLLDVPSLSLDTEDSVSGLTPLAAAVQVGKLSLVRDLIKRGARLGSEVLLAAEHGHCEIAEYLVGEGAHVDSRDTRGRTGLMLAAAQAHSALLATLLKLGAGVEEADQEGLTPLGHSVISGHSDTAEWLLSKGAKVNTADCYNRSPLDVAIYQGQPAMVETLLDSGANMEQPDARGIKPLDRVIAHGNTDILSVFLRKGAKLGSATWAMARGQEEIQVILLNKLLEDGNTLYRQQRLVEASHRYKYALKRLTGIQPSPEMRDTFSLLEVNLLLNLSRVERRQGKFLSAMQLSSRVLQAQPQSVQALCTRAKAERSLGLTKEALLDFRAAAQLLPENRELRRVVLKLSSAGRPDQMSTSFSSHSFQSTDSLRFIDESSVEMETDIC